MNKDEKIVAKLEYINSKRTSETLKKGGNNMVMKDCLEKNVQKKVLIEKHREYYLVLDEETGAIFLVNETSHFLYENCDGQSVESLCELLFDQCIDKDQLDKRTVYEGCTKALETLLKMELLTIK